MSLFKSLTDYGVPANSSADVGNLLNTAFAQAKADRVGVLLGETQGIYNHGNTLFIDGITFDGQGCALVATSPVTSTINVNGAYTGIRNVTLLGSATSRSGNPDTNGLTVTASDFIIENVRVAGASAGVGFAGSGAFFSVAQRGVVRNLKVRDSYADGIHVTYGSVDLCFYSCSSTNTGDDGFAVVSYATDNGKPGRLCKRISSFNFVADRCRARGLSVVGGENILYVGPILLSTSGAAVYIRSEPESESNTFGIVNCVVRDFIAENCVTGIGLGSGPNKRLAQRALS